MPGPVLPGMIEDPVQVMGTPRRPTPRVELPDKERYHRGEVVRDRYHLIRPLGQGGFGRVWVAHDTVLDVNVALKILYTTEDTPKALWDRLLQEARSAARFRHPAIVRVFDFGETERDDPFVAMELLDGETLYDMIQRETRLPGPRAIQLLLPIADALHTAHSKGVVHRDVKPENVFISVDELGRLHPKLLDFGIARHTDIDRKLTAQGAVIGTPDYMSPEQARGEAAADARTDIWSFCVMIYECVTGQMPFQGENYNALLNAIIRGDPKPAHLLAGGDADLWRVIERGLKKEPDERWESMRALGEALALWSFERGVREDISGASLRTSWLEADYSEIKVRIDSTAPSGPAPTIPPEAAAEPEPPSIHGAVTRHVATAGASSRSRWIALAVAGLAAMVLVAVLVTLRRSAAVEHGIESADSRPTGADQEHPALPPTTRVLSAPPSSVPESTATVPSAPASKAPRAPAAAPALKGKKTRTTKGKPAPDFGF